MNIDERIEVIVNEYDGQMDDPREVRPMIKQLLRDVLDEVKPDHIPLIPNPDDPLTPLTAELAVRHATPIAYNHALNDLEANIKKLGL